MSCIEEVDGPFAVINADDYYGVHAFQMAYDFLTKTEDTDKYHYMMVGYRLENTLTEDVYKRQGAFHCEARSGAPQSRYLSGQRSGRRNKNRAGVLKKEHQLFLPVPGMVCVYRVVLDSAASSATMMALGWNCRMLAGT